MLFLKRASLLLPLLAVAAAVRADRTFEPVAGTPAVRARIVRPALMVPRIQRWDGVRHLTQPENEFKWSYGPGEPNNAALGGELAEGRVGGISGVFFPTNGATGYEPPDPDIAAGRSAIAVAVNDTIGFYTPSGTQTFLKPLGQFFSAVSPGSFIFDPKVNYDPITGRFYLVALDVDFTAKTSSYLIGVSSGEDPLSPWKLYKVDNSSSANGGAHWLDYDGWGLNGDSIVASGNMFPFDAGNVFASVFVFRKADLIAGTAQATRFDLPDFTVQIARTFGTGPYAYAVSTGSQTSMNVYAIKTSAPPSVTQTSVGVPRWNFADDATDPGGHAIQVNDPRTLNSAFRNGRLVASHSVGVSASDSRGAARWYEFNVGNWPSSGAVTLSQSGQLNPPATAAYLFPAITADVDGNLGMTFSKVDTVRGFTMMASGRKVTDSVGLMGAPTVLETGLSTKYKGFSSRWGDYHDIEVDPVDGRKFWAVGMAPDAQGGWLTFAKSFNVASGSDAATAVNARDIAPFSGSFRSGAVASLFAKDSQPLTITGEAIPGLGRAAGDVSNFVSPVLAADLGFFRVQVDGTAPPEARAALFMVNRSSGKYDVIKTFPASGAFTLDLTAEQVAPYIGPGGEFTAAVRAVVPPRQGRPVPAFDYRLDRFNFLVLARPAP